MTLNELAAAYVKARTEDRDSEATEAAREALCQHLAFDADAPEDDKENEAYVEGWFNTLVQRAEREAA